MNEETKARKALAEDIRKLPGTAHKLNLTGPEVEALKGICEAYLARFRGGRPKKHKDDQARYKYHNERRKKKRKES